MATTAGGEATPMRTQAAGAGSAEEEVGGESAHGTTAGTAEARGGEDKCMSEQEAEIARVLGCVQGTGGWRDVMGVEGDADGRLARQAFATTIMLVHPDNNGRSKDAVEATRRMYTARAELVQEEQARRRRNETATTAAARQKKRQ